MLSIEGLPIEEKLDPRKRRTRQLLHQALVELMAEKGFDAISVQDIAERATINRATFYDHFEDKNALLDYGIRELFRDALRKDLLPDARLNGENLRRLIELTCQFLSSFYSRCAMTYSRLEPIVERQVRTQLYALLLGWLTGKRSYDALGYVAPELKATIASGAILATAQYWVRHQEIPLAELSRQVLPMVGATLKLDQASYGSH